MNNYVSIIAKYKKTLNNAFRSYGIIGKELLNYVKKSKNISFFVLKSRKRETDC